MVCMNAHAMEIDAIDADGKTALHRAALSNDLEKIKGLLAVGVNIESKDDQGNTPLHLAASDGRVDILKALAVAGADIEANNKEGETPLHRAALYDRAEAIVELVVLRAHKEVKKADMILLRTEMRDFSNFNFMEGERLSKYVSPLSCESSYHLFLNRYQTIVRNKNG